MCTCERLVSLSYKTSLPQSRIFSVRSLGMFFCLFVFFPSFLVAAVKILSTTFILKDGKYHFFLTELETIEEEEESLPDIQLNNVV